MFTFLGKLFNKSPKTSQKEERSQTKVYQSFYGNFAIDEWHEILLGDIYAKKARADGRYEVAEAFHEIGTQNYLTDVVGNRANAPMTLEQQEQFEAYHTYLVEYMPEYQHLIQTRKKIIVYLSEHSEGIQRDKLKSILGGHDGSTKWGVICNQLDRGGFIRQEGKIVFPATVIPPTNAEYLELLKAKIADEKEKTQHLAHVGTVIT